MLKTFLKIRIQYVYPAQPFRNNLYIVALSLVFLWCSLLWSCSSKNNCCLFHTFTHLFSQATRRIETREVSLGSSRTRNTNSASLFHVTGRLFLAFYFETHILGSLIVISFEHVRIVYPYCTSYNITVGDREVHLTSFEIFAKHYLGFVRYTKMILFLVELI